MEGFSPRTVAQHVNETVRGVLIGNFETLEAVLQKSVTSERPGEKNEVGGSKNKDKSHWWKLSFYLTGEEKIPDRSFEHRRSPR